MLLTKNKSARVKKEERASEDFEQDFEFEVQVSLLGDCSG
jgi:hypothetical protein